MIVQNRAWRTFACIMALMIVPEFLMLPTGQIWFDRTRHAFDTVAAVGLIGYAFGRQWGPRRLWRVYAPIFVLFTTWAFALGVGKTAAKYGHTLTDPIRISAMIAVFAPMAIATTLCCIALLRYGRWMSDGRSKPQIANVFG